MSVAAAWGRLCAVLLSVQPSTRRAVLAFAGALGTILGSGVAMAHPIHTTLTVITFDKTGTRLMMRAFADDFSASVARFVGKPAPRDSIAGDADVMRYVSAHLLLANAAGASIVLQRCGVRRQGGLYWVCLRAPRAASGSGWTVRNLMLTDLHSDQVNIVRVEYTNERRTLVFTKGSAASSIN